jgi:8-amino-7-oxononanoate synthase
MPSLSDALNPALAELDAQQLLRVRREVRPQSGATLNVNGRPRLSFGSNDYLGLAQHPALIAAAQEAAARYGTGSTASPLVCGHSPAHEALERELAAFVGLPRALYFTSGYMANVGCIPALVGKGDAIFSDALNHACLIDGARLSKAELHVHPHNDLAALGAALAAARGVRRRLVITDAVFSMDGDLAPLPDLLALCERHDAWLMIDDAHGFGVIGEAGRGTLSHFGLAGRRVTGRLVYMATLGKAAGVAGAFVAGGEAVVEWLMQRARTYMFATGAPALIAEALRASLRVIAEEEWRREHLKRLHVKLREGLATLPWQAPRSDTAIQPLILGETATALEVMSALDAQGLWVPAIRPPTVPAGTSRLRICLSTAHTEDDVQRLCHAVAQVSPGDGEKAAVRP